MSRIGKLPIQLPGSVKVTLEPGKVKVEGPKGQLERTLPAEITVKQVDGQLIFERPDDGYRNRAMHGLVRSLVNNMVTGVNTGFVKNLELVGVEVLAGGVEALQDGGDEQPGGVEGGLAPGP